MGFIIPRFGELQSRAARPDALSPEEAIKQAEQAAHAADFIVKRSTDESISPDSQVLRLEVPEEPINAELN